MSPHAEPEALSVNGYHASPLDGHMNGTSPVANGTNPVNGTSTIDGQKHGSHLRHTPDDELHDVICIGFGPAALAIGVALHDALDSSHALSGLPDGRPPKVSFLEQQPRFAWHAGMLLEGAKMQITFIKDMATLRNPRSEFTFLNYLHRNNRLVEFTNLSTFLPQRIEYEDYMRWCAGWFDEVVHYNQRVLEVIPEKNSDGIVNSFKVMSTTTQPNGPVICRRAKHVVVATGGIPKIPKQYPQRHPRVIHSSQYSLVIPQIFTNRQHPYRFAVLGSGQSAAEIFENLGSHYPNAKTTLVIKNAALKPSDDSPFVNEIFNPSRVDDVYQREVTLRAASLREDKNTNYGVVRLELIERIYEDLYTQRLRYTSEAEWPHKILNHRTVTRIEDSPALPDGVRLHIRNEAGAYYVNEACSEDDILDVDAVLVATGYRRDAHEEILKEARWLLPEGSQKWKVSRDYRVQFEKGLVSPDTGVWLQGCCEDTHGLSDSLLSILAVRGGEVVESIFGSGSQPEKAAKLNGVNGVNGH